MSLDVFGVALRPHVLDKTDLHKLVGSSLTRRFPDLNDYPTLRCEAEERARAASTAAGGAALGIATISDHLEQVLGRSRRDEPAAVIARCAIDLELELEQLIGRADRDVLRIQEQATERGTAVACVTDSYLPRDLIARMLSEAGIEPDHLLVASNEGVTKESGLFERLLAVTGAQAGQVIHLGSDQRLDVDQPARLGIRGRLLPLAAGSTRGFFELGLTERSGIDSIALTLADNRFRRRGELHSRPEDIGYYAGGPLAAGFSTWVGQQIDDLRPHQVLFCGPGGALLHQVTTILRPDLPADRLTTFLPPEQGACPFGHLDRLSDVVHADDGASILVVETGLGGRCHPLVQDWADRNGRSLSITGAYLGLHGSEPKVGLSWASSDSPSCPIEQRISRRPEIIEALLRSFPAAAKDLPRPLRSFKATGREVAAGVIGYAEDFQPWVRLDRRNLTAALAEPALRVISDPTAAEARTFGAYPGWCGIEGDRPTPLVVVPRRLGVRRHPGRFGAARRRMATATDGALWREGLQALGDGR